MSAKSVTVADACRMIADRTGDQQAAHILRQAGDELDRLTADLAKHQPEERVGECWCEPPHDRPFQWRPDGLPRVTSEACWYDTLTRDRSTPGFYCPRCGAHLGADGISRRNGDAALLDALARLTLESAEHGEAVEIDARAMQRLGVIGLSAWPNGTVIGEEWVGPDLRSAIRAALVVRVVTAG